MPWHTNIVFDESYPDHQLTADFWLDELLMAQADDLLRRMESGEIEPPFTEYLIDNFLLT